VELSEDVDVLNNISLYVPLGARLVCSVIDKSALMKTRQSYRVGHTTSREENTHNDGVPYCSFLNGEGGHAKAPKPSNGDLVIGRINRSLPVIQPPALTMELRGGYIGRCW
jgi:hypothetical protein